MNHYHILQTDLRKQEMNVTKIGDGYQVRVEELLPCPKFRCNHELTSCATTLWCPDGCFDTNKYVGVCIPKCIDCVFYPSCEEWEQFPDKHEHSALSTRILFLKSFMSIADFVLVLLQQ